jgi:hypothetical protein
MIHRAGKHHNTTKHFDISQFADNGLITGVKVLYSEYSIVGIEVVFAGSVSTGLMKGSHSVNLCEDAFSLLQGDYVVEIYGRHSDYLHCFGIKTKKGMTKTWGCPITGEPFRFNMNGSYIQSLKFGIDANVSYIEPVWQCESLINCRIAKWDLNGKFSEQVGKTHNDTIGFNDQFFVAGKWNYSIAQINCWHNGQFVFGVQFLYNMDDEVVSPGAHCAKGNWQCEQIKFNQGEHLVKVLVRHGDIIDGVTFYTDQGRVVKCGGNGGQPALIVSPPGTQIVALGGGTGGHLHNVVGFFENI